jgi:hypothetical protein
MNTPPPPKEFMSGHMPSNELLRAVVAASLDWEHRARENAEAARGRHAKPGWRDRTWLRLGSRRMIAALTLTLLIAAGTLAAPLMLGGGSELPRALVGHWQTSSAEYAGRALILSTDSIAIVAGEGLPVHSYPLRVLRAQQLGRQHRYDIEYVTAEGPLSVSILASRAGLRLLNRSDALWTRTAAAGR